MVLDGIQRASTSGCDPLRRPTDESKGGVDGVSVDTGAWSENWSKVIRNHRQPFNSTIRVFSAPSPRTQGVQVGSTVENGPSMPSSGRKRRFVQTGSSGDRDGSHRRRRRSLGDGPVLLPLFLAKPLPMYSPSGGGAGDDLVSTSKRIDIAQFARGCSEAPRRGGRQRAVGTRSHV